MLLETEARVLTADESKYMSFVVIIPARYASTRLAGKPLVDINGKPMILHVLERARESGAERIIVATDHEDVAAPLKPLAVKYV